MLIARALPINLDLRVDDGNFARVELAGARGELFGGLRRSRRMMELEDGPVLIEVPLLGGDMNGDLVELSRLGYPVSGGLGRAQSHPGRENRQSSLGPTPREYA